MPQISQDLMQYADITTWNPRVGDIIIKEGIIFRNYHLVESIKPDGTLVTRQAGLMRLICLGRHKMISLDPLKIKQSTVGSYTVFQNNVVYA